MSLFGMVASVDGKNKTKYQGQTGMGPHSTLGYPCIIVSEYSLGKWVKDKICTPKEMLDDPEGYDERSFTLMIMEVSQRCQWGISQKMAQIIRDLAGHLEKIAAKREKLLNEKPIDNENYQDELQRRRTFYLGKSLKSHTPGLPLNRLMKSHKLSAKTREKIGTVGSEVREHQPAEHFLNPKEKKYPVYLDGKLSEKLLHAAYSRARMNGDDSIAARAKKMLKEHFNHEVKENE